MLMTRVLVYAISMAALLLVTSCSSNVRTKVNTFRLDGAMLGVGSIKVVSPPRNTDSTLEYAYYSSYLQEALRGAGYTIVRPSEDSDYIAYLNYSVSEADGDSVSPFSSNLFAISGPVYHGRGGTVGLVVVEDARRRLLYQRTIQLVIARGDDNRQRVYEATGVSRGHCDTLSAVFEEMIQAMLTNFPASNGSIKNHSVLGDASC